MLAFITTEFQKLKRYSIILVGMLGVACSPIISIVMQKIMTDEAKNVLNYTFPDLLNSTIWNNMLILSLIIISIPQKETLATPLSQKRRKTERKIAK